MALTCPRCRRNIDYSGERPSFCAYCGQPLATSSGAGDADERTIPEPDVTVDYLASNSTQVHPWPARPTVAYPETIAGYRLIRKLGQGGMGSVHEAEEEASGRRVAVKLIAPEFTASSTAVERFLQEGRLASGIAHPRCVFVLAADQADGWPYIVMELMPGHTLKDLVETQGPLPQGEAVAKILDVIEGLDEAHKLGVVHRDVKPSNCFLDAQGRVKVGDFGLSKSLLGSDANLTRSGSFLGTPHYAAPEQIKGEITDAQSDVYSVAATLFYLLTGKPPFDAKDATVTLARIVTEQAPEIRSIRPEVWVALDRVVQKGLERDRRRRYRDLEEFRAALLPFLPGRVSLSRLGLRMAAYAIDFLVTTTLISVVVIPLEAMGQDRTQIFTRDRSEAWNLELLSGLIVSLYFGLSELLGSGTIGKRLMGLRVVSVARGGAMTFGEALCRLLLFAAVVVYPRRIYTMWLASGGFRVTFEIAVMIQVAALPILFATARTRNGYRGVHEILSGTAVISLPGRVRRRRRRAATPAADGHEPTLHLSHPEGLPTALGPFAIEGALAWSDDQRILLGEDPALGRAVWIAMYPEDNDPISPARRDIGRLARPRWLHGGEHDGRCWEAFVAPAGGPIADFVAVAGRLDWHEARSILEALAAELVAAAEDGTLPRSLSIDGVWIQPDGRITLIDASFDPTPGPHPLIEGPDPHRRSLELLRRVATLTISGRPAGPADHPRSVGGPVPLHAVDGLERLCGLARPYATVAAFLDDLERTREAVPELTRPQQLGHAAYACAAIVVKSWLFPAIVMTFLIAIAMIEHRGVPDVPQSTFDEIIVVQSCLWVLLAILVRDGFGGWIWGLSILRADGRRLSRLRLAWREALIWLPLLAIDIAFEQIPAGGRFGGLREAGTFVYMLIMPALYVIPALFHRGRYLNDRMARTAVVPR